MEQQTQKNYYLITILGIITLIITCLIAIQIILEKISYINIQIVITFIISLVWLVSFYLNFKRLKRLEKTINLIILILVLLIFFIVHYNLYRLFI